MPFKPCSSNRTYIGIHTRSKILGGIKPETYYLTCGPTAKCDRPTEYIKIYTFKSDVERDKGLESLIEFEKKTDMILPAVWKHSQTLLLYWNGAEAGKKTPYADKIEKALAGWEKVK